VCSEFLESCRVVLEKTAHDFKLGVDSATDDTPPTLRRCGHDFQAKLDFEGPVLHRPRVGGGTTFKLS